MPIVTNNAKSERGLCFKPEAQKGQLTSAANIERVEIPVGKSVDVDEKFLSTEGAKAMLASGELSIGSAKVEDSPDDAPEKDSKTDIDQESGSKKKSKGGK